MEKNPNVNWLTSAISPTNRNHILLVGGLVFLLFSILLNAKGAFAASCPCCGQQYGEPAPGDEARVYELRRAHEASCPACPKASTPGYQQPTIDSGKIQRRELEEQHELERQRRDADRLEAERRERERQAQEEARRKQFEQDKQEALNMLKSGAGQLGLESGPEGELGLKGISGSEPKLKGVEPAKPTLKEPLFSKGNKGSAPPYPADLSPEWPIVTDPAKVEGGTPEALRAANRKTRILLEVLGDHPNNWEGSLRELENRFMKNPDDTAVEDALSYLHGLHKGYIDARDASNSFYKHGVRRWLQGDYDTAARAFARAVRENPDDIQAFRTFAYAAGLRDGTGQCERPRGCSHIFDELPEKRMSADTDYSKESMEAFRQSAAAIPYGLEARHRLNYAEGLMAYRYYVDGVFRRKGKQRDDRANKLVNEVLERIRQNDYDGAFRAINEGYEESMDDQGLLFVKYYAGALADTQGNDGLPNDQYKPWDYRAERISGEMVREVWLPPGIEEEIKIRDLEMDVLVDRLEKTETHNPFFGRLSDEQEDDLVMMNFGWYTGDGK
ncbi:MAG: hypothetical protein JRJ47_10995 [Deltaproteobacteria bacterium]|nr:hypothetical protein [Deltaproteobacteria bacterium]